MASPRKVLIVVERLLGMIAENFEFISAMVAHGQVQSLCNTGVETNAVRFRRPNHRLGAAGLQLFLVLLPLAFCGLAGCASVSSSAESPPGDCLRRAQARIEAMPARDCLPTLDGQCVPLQPFFDACAALWPNCVLYAKFYHWESEVVEITSPTPHGPVGHRVRIYHSILHACDPDYQDVQRTHGDVAEFYDQTGRFMGLAVYMGQGVYCPLPAVDGEARP